MESIQRYYSGIVGKRRVNAPTITEAKRDLAAGTYLPLFEA
jgi:hypothetical protein